MDVGTVFLFVDIEDLLATGVKPRPFGNDAGVLFIILVGQVFDLPRSVFLHISGRVDFVLNNGQEFVEDLHELLVVLG